MNALLIITGIIICAMMLDGYRIGLVKSVFALVKMIIGAVVAAVTVYCVTTIVPPSLRYIIPGIFISVIALVFAVVGLFVGLLNLVDEIPVLKQINRLAGIVSGAVHGIVCVWILFVVIAYFSDTSAGSIFFKMIMEDELLSFLYEANPFGMVIEKWNVFFA